MHCQLFLVEVVKSQKWHSLVTNTNIASTHFCSIASKTSLQCAQVDAVGNTKSKKYLLAGAWNVYFDTWQSAFWQTWLFDTTHKISKPLTPLLYLTLTAISLILPKYFSAGLPPNHTHVLLYNRSAIFAEKVFSLAQVNCPSLAASCPVLLA